MLRHRTFESGRFDLGNMTQAVWSTANGDVLSVTDVHGEQILRLASHFDPILAALAPLWWVWPSPERCSFCRPSRSQRERSRSIWLARRHSPEWPAAAIACAYLLFPPVQWLTVSDFHPVALARRSFWSPGSSSTPGGSGRSRCSPRRRSRRRSTSGSRSPALGVWYALAGRAPGPGPRSRLRGRGRARRRARRRPAFAPAGDVGVREPLGVRRSMGATSRYARCALLLPARAAAARARRSRAASPAVPELGLNVLSATITQTSVKTHYAAAAIPHAPRGSDVRRARHRRTAPATFVGARRDSARRRRARPGRRGRTLDAGRARCRARAGARARARRRAPSAPRTRSARTSPRVSGSSASPSSGADWVAVDTTRLTYLDSLRPDAPRPGSRRSARSGVAARLRRRTASSSSGM